MTDHCSYVLHGKFDTMGDFPFRYLDSLSVSFGEQGITASYNKSEKKAIPPASLIYAGERVGGMSANINLGGNFTRFPPRFAAKLMGKNAPRGPWPRHVRKKL